MSSSDMAYRSSNFKKFLVGYNLDPVVDQFFRTPRTGFHDALKKLPTVNQPAFPIATRLPCANVQVATHAVCAEPGTMACSQCRLVSYCSKECQNAHWKLHKKDCKSHIRSDGWLPSWLAEKRPPHFIARDEADMYTFMDPSEFNGGCSLWGNVPAMDVINLNENEQDTTKDFSLAFAASGDIHHVIKTINSLPSNFSGSLDILINDGSEFVACRNIVLILILGLIPDETLAADIALHFWYSAFFPIQYRLQISMLLLPFLEHTFAEATKRDGNMVPYNLEGGKSTLNGCCHPEDIRKCFMHYVSSTAISLEAAQNEYDRVRMAYPRRDYRDRMYDNLRPSHRAAFYKYRKVGIILPFGAVHAHFNVPNASLFSLEGRWLQTDFADPLEGWDIDEVIEGGKKFGAKPEDVYGCLYLFLSNQLRTFTHRVRTIPMAFKVLSAEAIKLASRISEGVLTDIGLTPATRFDRIEVSNIMDPNYAGLRAVLLGWGNLLVTGKDAAIVGYFMNWFLDQKDGRVMQAGDATVKHFFHKIVKKHKIEGMRRASTVTSRQADIFSIARDFDALYENSRPFSEFLEKQELNTVLRQTKLELRERHRIVPHRLRVPLHASASALPGFEDDEAWYYNTKLKSYTWVERFVEFSWER